MGDAARLLRQPLIVFDTETSGLPRHSWARPIEVGYVLLDTDGSEVSTFESLIRPIELPQEADYALQVNHLTREEVMGAPMLDEVDARFLEWLAEHDAQEWHYTSFNIGFDRPMMARLRPEADGYRSRWSACIMLSCHRIMDRDETCSVKRWSNGELKWPTLSEAADYFKVSICEPQHRALGDARTAAELVRTLARRRS